jgi:hypothetical protein
MLKLIAGNDPELQKTLIEVLRAISLKLLTLQPNQPKTND